MAGLFGFFTDQTRPREWMDARARRMLRAMTDRPSHHHFIDIGDRLACGYTGPALHDGERHPHPGPDGFVLYGEGEIYHAHETLGPAAPGEAIWDQVRQRWQRRGPASMRDVDGLYNLVLYEPASADGPRVSILNDRYGSRRLYVMQRPDALVFASELKAILAWPDATWTIDRAFVEETVCLGSVPGDKTWFREIRLLPPASAMTVSARRSSTCRYWKWSELPEPGSHAGRDGVEQLHERWRRAIDARLTADAMGQQLSGGLDSRLILAEAAPRRPDWVSVTYGEPGSDEVRFAQRCARLSQRRWVFWELPGADWLERRVALSLEMDGLLDLANAHHAGLVERMGALMRFEMSGYLGDLIAGDTWSGAQTAEDALDCLAHWDSPVSIDRAGAIERVAAALDGTSAPVWWLVDEKCRKATNGWPHLAVNDLEVRKPFMDYALVEFCAGLPSDDRRDRRIVRQLLAAYYPSFAALPYQKTGVRPDAPAWQLTALRAARVAYRSVQPAAERAGVPLRPWIRGAVDLGRWLSDPAVRSEIASTLTASGARVGGYFDRAAIGRTIDLTFDEGAIAAEVVLNLYRVERYLQHAPSLASSTRD